MADTLTPEARSERMSRIRGRDTGPEWTVRRIVHGLGYRYRLHGKRLPGRPDLVFPSRRKVIFVHGCFWHAHAEPACIKATIPKSRRQFWLSKFEGNTQRDLRVQAQLRAAGWAVLVLWECQLRDQAKLKKRLVNFLR